MARASFKLIGTKNSGPVAGRRQLIQLSQSPGFLFGMVDQIDYHVECYFACTSERLDRVLRPTPVKEQEA